LCNISGIAFYISSFTPEDVEGKRVIDVGSRSPTNNVRAIIEKWNPKEYVGIDKIGGTCVDIVCSVEDAVERFGNESFDIVISTETLEHIRDWKKAISNMKKICKHGGKILITTRSRGFGYHPSPNTPDYWRFETDDLRVIFTDCDILGLDNDYESPGAFIVVEKPKDFVENVLSNYAIYSMITGKREIEIYEKDKRNMQFIWMKLKHKSSFFIPPVVQIIRKRITRNRGEKIWEL